MDKPELPGGREGGSGALGEIEIILEAIEQERTPQRLLELASQLQNALLARRRAEVEPAAVASLSEMR
jgi:hypothetical protein